MDLHFSFELCYNVLMIITTAGLLLKEIPYLGKKKILKIFTPDQGLVSLFAQSIPLSPFALAEWVFRKSEKEIHFLKDVTLIDPLLYLRQDYQAISAAGSIAQDLLCTQFPDKQAPELFELVLLYLKKLPFAPESITASFRLKLLLHEGLISEDPDPAFTPEEWKEVYTLAFSRSLSAIENVRLPPLNKIRHFFERRVL